MINAKKTVKIILNDDNDYIVIAIADTNHNVNIIDDTLMITFLLLLLIG